MGEWTAILQAWGVWGLALASFTEAFCSPVLPDVVLVPLALAQPEQALFFGLVATCTSVLGGFIGYFLGARLGVKAARKLLPERQLQRLKHCVEGNALWAVFLAVMSPVPYKCITIAAGALGMRLPVFLAISVLGRAKRFFLEALLIYWYGPQAVAWLNRYGDGMLWGSLAVLGAALVGWYVRRRWRKPAVVLVEADKTGA